MEMKERQRWSVEEDTLLRAYVKQYGPREWHLVSQRMNTPLHRDAKSCLERWKNYLKPGIKKGSLTEDEQRLVIRLQAKHGNKWKNYLKPGIKKGSLTEEEQRLVIRLQAKHGNKWKKIAAEVPGRTAKRLGKWWEVYKEKQQREKKENNKLIDPIEERKYDTILENFAEKLVKELAAGPPFLMTASNGGGSSGFLRADHPPSVPSLPAWISTSNGLSTARPPSPSVTLCLSSAISPPPAPIPWLDPERGPDNAPLMGNLPSSSGESILMAELLDCCRELEEGHRSWAAHKKESAWRLKRVELQLQSEKANRRREKMEEIEVKVKALREEEKASLERIEADYRDQLAGMWREAEAKELKLAEQWAAKHLRLMKFIEQTSCGTRLREPNGS